MSKYLAIVACEPKTTSISSISTWQKEQRRGSFPFSSVWRWHQASNDVFVFSGLIAGIVALLLS